MGYACPVCGLPQADGAHLADHLALTALLHGDDHADWLDDRVPDWADRDAAALAEAVTPDAEPADYPTVFEDTVSHRGHGTSGRTHGTGEDGESTTRGPVASTGRPVEGDAPAASEVRAVIEETRAMARERRDRRSSAGDEDSGGAERSSDDPDGSG